MPTTLVWGAVAASVAGKTPTITGFLHRRVGEKGHRRHRATSRMAAVTIATSWGRARSGSHSPEG